MMDGYTIRLKWLGHIIFVLQASDIMKNEAAIIIITCNNYNNNNNYIVEY